MNALPEFAKSVRIGHLNIAVSLVPQKIADLADIYGAFLKPSLEILIQENLQPGLMRDTLLHEIMHAFYFVYARNNDIPEEDVACLMPGALIRLKQDNEALFGWLFFPGPNES